MNKRELQHAQALHSAWHSLQGVYVERAPDSTKPTNDIVAGLARDAARLAYTAFFHFTGRAVYDVSITELSTVNPADWAREHKPYS